MPIFLKRLLGVLAWLIITTMTAAAQQYAELRLRDGTVLTNVTIVAINSGGVMAKWSNGRGTIAAENLPAETRTALGLKTPALRLDEPTRKVAEEQPKKVILAPAKATQAAREKPMTPKKRLVLKGQIFVQTRGTGPYKFSGVNVYVFDEFVSGFFDTNSYIIDLPKPIAKTATDAEGKFSFDLDLDRDVFVYARAYKMVEYTKIFEWRILTKDVKDNLNLLLFNDNLTETQKTVKIAE